MSEWQKFQQQGSQDQQAATRGLECKLELSRKSQ